MLSMCASALNFLMLAELIAQVQQSHLEHACRSMRRRITPEVLQELEAWRDQLGR